ncbi:MAG TPA: hypothetical protein VLQ45_35205 [Thermoanaerobaculia bacterium]|nr:hypothetical protein [Thermoanaerobaculia bacterium]
MTWKPDPILRALLGWTALSTLIFWLPFVRGIFDGETYEWGLAGMGGTGISGDYWMPALGVALALSILAIFWVIRDMRSGRTRETPPWTPANQWMTIALAALLPVQFVLLRFGEPHGTTDQIGVILTMLQWFLLGAALAPKRPAHPAAVLAEGRA